MITPHNPIVALVDDDKIFQLTASKTIRAAHLTERILQFENGEQACVFLSDHAGQAEVLPDFIFLDINMPFVDGWMFLEEFKKIKEKLSKQIRIFMVSSSIDPRDIDRAKSNEYVEDYVLKPVTREKFTDILSRS